MTHYHLLILINPFKGQVNYIIFTINNKLIYLLLLLMKILLKQIKLKEWNIIINNNTIKNPIFKSNYLIHYAGYQNNIELLKEIINFGGPKQIFKINSWGDTIAHITAEYGYYELLNEIIKIDYNILNFQNKSCMTPLHLLGSNYKVLSNILEKYSSKINFDLMSKDYGTLLVHNIINSESENDDAYRICKLLLEYDVNINIPKTFTPLHGSCKYKKLHIVKLLIKYKVDINPIDINNRIPLNYAIFNNDFETCKILLENGADYNYVYPVDSIYIIYYVLKNTKNDIIKLFLNYDINLDIYSSYLDTPLHQVLINKADTYPQDIINILLEKTSNINFQNIDGNTCLHLIIINYNWKDYQKILKKKYLDYSISFLNTNNTMLHKIHLGHQFWNYMDIVHLLFFVNYSFLESHMVIYI